MGMIELSEIRYVRLGTGDVDACVAFATEIIGLELVEHGTRAAYLRGDQKNHNICYFKGDTTDHTAGLRIEGEDAYEAARKTLADAGANVTVGTAGGAQERRVEDYFSFSDPTGNRFDLVYRPHNHTRPYFPGRAVNITEFSHIGLNTIDAKRDEKFWRTHFNMRANDWIGAAPLMSFDHVHHRIATFPADRPGIQHINFQVEGIDDIMRSWYWLQERQVPIRFGPGRHVTSGAIFVYYEGPDGMIYEYSTGVRSCDESWRPRQFPFTPDAFCGWGAKPQIPEFTA